MLSLSAFLASLPPAALAETDLARFVALVIGRRSRAELPGVALLLSEETIRGYPAGLAAILRATVEQLQTDDSPLELVDAGRIEQIFGSEPFLTRLAALCEVRRERLRPGTSVGPELRLVAGRRLRLLGGHGGRLCLVHPVDLARVPEAHFAIPRGPVLAMMVEDEEGEALRSVWSSIEALTGLDGPEAGAWTARFFAVARRPASAVQVVQKALVGIPPELRQRLLEALIAHARDGELPEHHRPGQRGLERRLAPLGREADAPWVEPALALVREIFEGAGVDPAVEAGYCHCPEEDLALWSQWVEVPAAARDAVARMDCAAIEHALVLLAEVEAGRIDHPIEPSLRRGLQSLRDHCLRPRWRRSRAVLEGLDAMRLCDAFVARGLDKEAKVEALLRLGAEAEEALARRPVAPVSAPVEEPELPEPPAPAGDVQVEAAPASPPPAAPPVAAAEPPRPSQAPASAAPPVVASTEVAAPQGARPFTLPPMPKPPPLRVRQPTEGAGLAPEVERPRASPPPVESAARAAQRARVLGREGGDRVPPEAGPRTPGGASRRPTTASHLITPAQALAFYEDAFRSLEVLEREVLRVGSTPAVGERLDLLAEEVTAMVSALGPSARSGDADFRAALERIERVESYLLRVRALCAEPREPAQRTRSWWKRLIGGE